jgi:hypothetical protein
MVTTVLSRAAEVHSVIGLGAARVLMVARINGDFLEEERG